MRENIGLYRGRRKDNGDWVKGSYLFLYAPDRDWTGKQFGKPQEVYYIVSKEDMPYSVDPDTIGECTGVPDINGKIMYEGDTVKGLFLWEEEILSTVDFKDGSFGLRWMYGDIEKFYPFTSMCNVKYEIVEQEGE